MIRVKIQNDNESPLDLVPDARFVEMKQDLYGNHVLPQVIAKLFLCVKDSNV